MKKTWLLIAVFALLGYAFVSSPPFQTIAAGVAICLFGMLFLEEGFQAIIDFATRALVAGNMTTRQSTQVQRIRLACRSAAEIIKVIAELRENVNRYMNHPNEHIRQQYNLIRQNLAEIVRRLLRMRESTGEFDISDGLAELREGLENQDVLANGTLDQLVRDHAIDSQMATSLMNDSAFAYDIGLRLIEIVEDIYMAEGVEIKKPAEELVLD